MNPLQIKVYDFFDIQKEICNLMNIKKEDFRDYHRVVGGEYKDLWHEWQNYIDSEFRNDTIRKTFMDNTLESYIGWIENDNKPWLRDFIIALDSIFTTYGDDNHSIYIQYSW
jgi:hypothetical protein